MALKCASRRDLTDDPKTSYDGDTNWHRGLAEAPISILIQLLPLELWVIKFIWILIFPWLFLRLLFPAWLYVVNSRHMTPETDLDSFGGLQGLLWRDSHLSFSQQLLDEVCDVSTSDGNVLYAATDDITFSLEAKGTSFGWCTNLHATIIIAV